MVDLGSFGDSLLSASLPDGVTPPESMPSETRPLIRAAEADESLLLPRPSLLLGMLSSEVCLETGFPLLLTLLVREDPGLPPRAVLPALPPRTMPLAALTCSVLTVDVRATAAAAAAEFLFSSATVLPSAAGARLAAGALASAGDLAASVLAFGFEDAAPPVVEPSLLDSTGLDSESSSMAFRRLGRYSAECSMLFRSCSMLISTLLPKPPTIRTCCFIGILLSGLSCSAEGSRVI
mmetsp:Transcript_28571/g.51069  ORF Transcript_28571/g.51069 Transcript_28571/m.51069 type:complete len:236 (-) Transcript_28571:1525-2232(-)